MQFVALLSPLLITLALAAVLRGVAGAERSAALMGAALALGFLAGWGLLVAPGWLAYDSLGRVGHIVFGGLVAGVALDLLGAGPRLFWSVAIPLLAGSAWAEANGGLWPTRSTPVAVLVTTGALLTTGLALTWCVRRLGEQTSDHAKPGVRCAIIAAMAALSLAGIAAVVADTAMRQTGVALALALGGVLAWWSVLDAPWPRAHTLVISAALLATSWAIVERNPGTLPGVLVTGLVFFAGGTAARVPLPRAGISRWLYPAVLAAIAAIPAVLAAAVTFALRGALRGRI